ncbi:MAG TPA: hypothetical protein VD837_08845 [Terriglobales bacterium]|nr:hypothetical protein [Terriglobales bacterium]
MSFGWRVFAVLLLSTAAYAGTPGTFRGIVYSGQDTRPGWVYVVGRNDTLRLVHIKNANFTYAEEFPNRLRRANPAKSLKPGADVRVTAEQDSNGHWQATDVEIIALDAGRRDRKRGEIPEPSQRRPELQTRKN